MSIRIQFLVWLATPFLMLGGLELLSLLGRRWTKENSRQEDAGIEN